MFLSLPPSLSKSNEKCPRVRIKEKKKKRMVCDLSKSQSKPTLQARVEPTAARGYPLPAAFPPSLSHLRLSGDRYCACCRPGLAGPGLWKTHQCARVCTLAPPGCTLLLLSTAHLEVSMQDGATVTIIHSLIHSFIHQAFIEHQICSRFCARCSVSNKMCKRLV